MSTALALPFVTVSSDIRNKGNAAQIKWRTERNWQAHRLFEHVTNGFPFAVGVYRDNRRRGDYFISGQLIGLDFDKLTLESAHKLLAEEFVSLYAAFVYSTPSHTPEAPRLRLVFVLEEPLEGKERYEISVSKLLSMFGDYNPDPACRDAARLFFGSNSPDPAYTAWLGHALPLSLLESLPGQISESEASESEQLPQAFIEALERELLLTGKKHGEFLECHCPIHPPDRSPSAAWHPEKRFLWCYHEGTHYLAKDVGARLGIHLRDYLPTRAAPIRQLARAEKRQIEGAIPPLSLTDDSPQFDADSIAEYALLNEYGDALLLLALVMRRLIYDHAQRNWYWWGGHFWIKDSRRKTPETLYMPTGEAYARAAGEFTTRQARLEAELETRKDDQALIADLNRIKAIAKELSSRPRALRTHTRSTNVLRIASGLSSLEGNEWDSDPMLLGVQNGVVDLRTGSLRSGRLEDYIRKAATVAYNPNARAPRWEQFILEIVDGNQDLACFLQRLLGYFITGLVSEHILPVCYGRGRNGKDTLMETIGYVMGDYAKAGTGELLIDTSTGGQATPHLFELQGRRLVWVTETSEGARLNVNQVKYLTGAGRISARPLYGNPIEFEATHHIILFTNHKPRVPSQSEDYAIWKRLLLIPLTLSFVDHPAAPHERPRDPYLKQKLINEGEGILAWLITGCQEWQKQGLNPPSSILQATEEYARSEDVVGLFLEDCCELHPQAKTQAQMLLEAYQKWAHVNGYPELGVRKFGERLTAQFSKERSSTGIVYVGVSLRQPEQ